MRHPIARSTLAACGAVALLGIVVAGARRARHKEFALVAQTDEPPPASREPTPLNIRAALRAVRSSPARFRAAAARERSEALSRRKQDFLGLLSHELRNPLSAIHAALAVMRARDGLQAGQRARAIIERQVEHIGRLVDDLVDTARIERGTLSLQLETVDVRDVLSTAVDMAQPSVAHRQQTFDWQPSEEPLLVNGDRVRLQQVFSNLLLNASKYTPERGRIELVTYRAGSDFCVEVHDNGRGIAAEDLTRVFEPFVRATRDEPGLGVGLYVARTLVEQHGGVISVDSRGLHTGTTFTVRLPELSPLLRQVSTSG
jgi:two-component system, sensor histidine kinase